MELVAGGAAARLRHALAERGSGVDQEGRRRQQHEDGAVVRGRGDRLVGARGAGAGIERGRGDGIAAAGGEPGDVGAAVLVTLERALLLAAAVGGAPAHVRAAPRAGDGQHRADAEHREERYREETPGHGQVGR